MLIALHAKIGVQYTFNNHQQSNELFYRKRVRKLHVLSIIVLLECVHFLFTELRLHSVFSRCMLRQSI